jgi:hypothetical protein
MNKKVELLVKKGFNESLSTLFVWKEFSEEEKEDLTFEQSFGFWDCIPKDDSRKAEAFELVKKKAVTISQLRRLWEETSDDSFEKRVVLKMMEAKAEEILAKS